MTFDKFIKKWLGEKIDFDGYYEGQCVDLYRQYVQEVLGFPQSVSVRGAMNIWDTVSFEYYDLIKNTPKAIPDKGDIIIWNKNVGKGFGHVSIFLTGNVNSFTSLDQNWPTLNKVTKTEHDYNNIIGWLHPKEKTIMSNIYKGLDLNNQESMKVCVDTWKDVADGKYVKKENCDKIRKESDEKIKQLEENYKIKLVNIKSQQKEEINNAITKAKKDWKVVELQDKVQEYEKIRKTTAYKVAVAITEVLQTLKIIKKE